MSQIEITQMLRDKYKIMLLTKSQTAKELGVSPTTIDRLRKEEILVAKKVLGRIMFSIDEIARFISDR